MGRKLMFGFEQKIKIAYSGHSFEPFVKNIDRS